MSTLPIRSLTLLAAICTSACSAPASTATADPTGTPGSHVTALRATTKAVAGAATWADLTRDEDPDDAVEPVVPITFAAPDYAGGDATVRVRGGKASRRGAKSYRIDLVEGAPQWRGADEVLLQKHAGDPSRSRAKLAYDLFQGLPELPSPRAWLASFTVDETDLGLFTETERVDKGFLKRVGLDADGYLYQVENFAFEDHGGDVARSSAEGYDEDAFEERLEIEGAKDHEKLLTLIEAIADEKAPIDTVIARHLDRENLLTWLAASILTENYETRKEGYFLHAPKGDGPWRFIPGDHDTAFGANAPARWQEGVGNWWNLALVRRFLQVPANLAALTSRVDQLAAGALSRSQLEAQLAGYQPAIVPFLARDPDQGLLPAGTDLAAESARIAGAAEAARARYHAALGRPLPVELADDEAGAGQWNLRWDASYDFQGDALTYDLTVARDPGLTDVVLARKGLTARTATVPLADGTYYWTVTIRDAGGEWQIPSEDWTDDTGRSYPGVKRLEAK